MINVAELKVDHSYQREEGNDRIILAIARNFSWEAFGSLVVMERHNGERFVVDGQQRLLAARRRGDTRMVPCVVFMSDGREHEARAFISLNVNRSHVSAAAKFSAAVMAGLHPEVEIASWLTTVGRRVDKYSKKDAVDFPATLTMTWQIDDEACRNSIVSEIELNGSEPLHSVCHKGLWWLEHNGIDTVMYIKKLQTMGGRSAILRAVKVLEIESGKAASLRTCGMGVLQLINHGRRSKRIEVLSAK
jgi:hypothetical protein